MGSIGIDESGRKAVAEALSGFLADTYAVYVKTQGFHWNVGGPHFMPLHEQFGAQYEEMAKAIDSVAERIRALGRVAPAGLARYAKMTSVKEESGTPTAAAMVLQLVADHEALSRHAHAVIKVAEQAGDAATADLMVERIHVHDQNAWMLRVQVE